MVTNLKLKNTSVITSLVISLLIMVLSLAQSNDTYAQEVNFVSVYPNPVDSYISNPGIGWQNVPGNTPYLLPETVGYATRENISWQVLNPSIGTYDWSALDNLIQNADATGKLFSFRVYTMQGESYGGHHVPQWVVERDSSMIQGGAPNYANCTYQTYWATFVDQLRRRYDGDNRIAYIDISGYGNFNEWSWTSGQTVWDDSFSNPQSLDGMARHRLADMYIGGADESHLCEDTNGNPQSTSYTYTGFQSTQLLMPYAGIQQASRYVASRRSDVGIRYDCLGRNESSNSDPMVKIGDLFEQTWRNAPIVFEFCAGSTTAPDVMERARNLINATHATLIHDNLNYPRDEAAIEALMTNVGYRYQLTQAVYEEAIVAGNNLNLTMAWQNVGTAPAYSSLGHDFALRVYVVNANGSTVLEHTSTTNLSWWMPADNLPDTAPNNMIGETITIPSDLEGGSYDLRVAIINTNTNQAINLAFEGNDGQRRYQIGRIEVSGESVPTSVPTLVPTSVPTLVPTNVPTLVPTNVPTLVPTSVPTLVPTNVPTLVPTNVPTLVPTNVPTLVPTNVPTLVPTSVPTLVPTSVPTLVPTSVPTLVPTNVPTLVPTSVPTLVPTSVPTLVPTNVPTLVPTSAPIPANTISIRNLDGDSWSQGRGRWTAYVDLSVGDSTGNFVSGATVTATWSDGTTFTCVTQGDWCGARLTDIPNGTASITFTILNITHPNYTYDPSANSDPQSGNNNRRASNGTSIMVNRR